MNYPINPRAGIANVVYTAGLISSWTEGGYTFAVNRNDQGCPLSISGVGGDHRINTQFDFDASGVFVGMKGDIVPSNMLQQLVVEAVGGRVVQSSVNVTGRVDFSPAGAEAVDGYQLCIAYRDASQKAMHSMQSGQAVFDAESNKTFFVFLGRDRALFASFYDHDARTYAKAVRVSDYPTQPEDDHGVPTMCINAAGNIIVIFGAHNNQPKVCKSVAPRDISAWSVRTANEIIGTYHTVTCDPASGVVYVGFRPGWDESTTFPSHQYATWWESSDGYATYSDTGARINLVGYTADAAHDAYIQDSVFFGGRIYFNLSVACGATHDGTRRDLLAGYVDLSDGHIYSLAGSDLGAVVSDEGGFSALRVHTSDKVYSQYMAIRGHDDIALIWNQHTSTKIEIWIGHWNGSDFYAANSDIAGHHNFDRSAVRATENGYEYFLISGRTSETPVFHPSNEPVGYVGCGNDLYVAAGTGRSALSARLIYEYGDVEGQGVHWVSVPRDAQDGLRAFVGSGASQNSLYGGSSPQRMPLYALQAGARSVYYAPVAPAVCVQQIVRTGVIKTLSAPAFDTWINDNDITSSVPKGCKRVLLCVTLKGPGTAAGNVVARLRSSASESNSGQIIWTSRGEWTENTTNHWLCMNEKDQFDFRWGGTSGAITSVEFYVAGYET